MSPPKTSQINYVALGHAIRSARKRQGYTQEHLAGVVGSSASTITRIEQGGERDIHADVFVALMFWLGAPLERFALNPTQNVSDTPSAVGEILRKDPLLDDKQRAALGSIFETAYKNANAFKRGPNVHKKR